MRPLLALFIRSLRDDLRGRAAMLVRAGLVVLILLFLWQTHTTQQWSGAVGRHFFTAVLWVDLFLLAVVGLSYFSSAIAEEKDENTLGLLRMTDLNALAILLGKSTSRMCGALLLIAAQLPFMLLAVTMGGLDVRQVLAGFALLISTTFFTANLALIGSVVCARTASATGLTAVLLGLFVFAPSMFGLDSYAVAHAGDAVGRSLHGWIEATPVFRLQQITATGFTGSVLGWHSGASVLLSGICFLIAWACFDRCAENEDGPDPSLLPVHAPQAATTRYGRPGKHALSWKDFHFVSGGYGGMIVKGTLAGGAFLVMMASAGPIVDSRTMERIGWPLLYIGFVSLVLSLSFSAARIFKMERRDQTLGDLAILPRSMSQVVLEKLRGCLIADWPLLAMVVLGLGLVTPSMLRDLSHSPRSFFTPIAFASCFAVSGVQLPLSITWMSLRVRWGGLPLGLTAWFLGNLAAVSVTPLILNDSGMLILLSAGIGVAGWLAFDIPRRLEKLAAGE